MTGPRNEDPAQRLTEAGFEAAPVAQVVTDGSGRLAAANRDARTLFGIEKRDVGRPLKDLEIAHNPLELLPRIERACLECHVVTASDIEWRAEGEVHHLDVRIQPLIDSAGESLGATIAFVDLSNYRRLRELEVMRDFLRNAAHQLRTPMTAIATAVEVLRAGAAERPAERDRFLAHIAEHAGRMIRLTHGLLVLARAQAGEPIPRVTVAVAPLLEELAHAAAPAEGVQILVDCGPDVQAIADHDLTHEAIAALVDNAIEHTRTGTIRLNAVAADGQVAISVVDEGGGIAPEHLERIFEPFYPPFAAQGGHGLGLAIAAQAVQAMSGELTAEESESGARFTIRLPSATRRQ